MNKKIFGFLSHLDLNLYLFRLPIMEELRKKGHKVYIICPEGNKNISFLELGYDVINYNIERKSLNPFSERKAINNIYNAIKDLNIDVLHTFTAKPNIYGTIAARKAGIPKIFNLVEGLGSFYTKDTLKYKLVRFMMENLYRKTFKKSDGCIFVNNDDPKYMISKKIIEKKNVKIIKSVGVDSKYFNINKFSSKKLEQIKKDNNTTNKVVVLMVARAIWDKGIKEYYEAANIINKELDNVEFLFVGPTDNGNLTCASEDYLNKGSVKWLGHRDDIDELTAICDVYVLPSYREGLPATLMEASSMSKPIVTTDAIGCREVVEDNKNGFLVPIKNSKVLADKIKQLILDKNLRDKMGKEGRKKVENEFMIEKVVEQYMGYYEKNI